MMLWLYLYASAAALLTSIVQPGLLNEHCQTDLVHNISLDYAVHQASKLVAYSGMVGDFKGHERISASIPMNERLLIQIVFTEGFLEDKIELRQKWLRCCLAKIEKFLIPHSHADVFVWVPEEKWSEPSWLHEFNNVHVFKLNNQTFGVPCNMPDHQSWQGRSEFEIDYYLTGRWRLTFSLEFAKKMGYEYILNIDDDTILTESVQYSIYNRAKTDNLKLAVLKNSKSRNLRYIDGLVELTKDWLLKRKYDIKGDFLCQFGDNITKDISSLNVSHWNREYYAGYFTLISVEWWFDPDVQDYLHTVLRSGKDIKHRWLEQGVLNMMRLIFVSKEEFLPIDDIHYSHTRDLAEHRLTCAEHMTLS